MAKSTFMKTLLNNSKNDFVYIIFALFLMKFSRLCAVCISACISVFFLNGCVFLDFNKQARLDGYQQTRQNLSITKSATIDSATNAHLSQPTQNVINTEQHTLTQPLMHSSTDSSETDFIESKENFILSELYKQQESWASTPYISGGIRREGADCSGFVMVVFDESFDIKLPRITLNQMAQGEKIGGKHTGVKKLQPADLLFFRTGRGAHGYHVGIYLQNGDFVHLSTKGGAKIVNISNKYWKDRLRKVVRYEIP